MNLLKSAAQNLLRRFGYDLVRYPMRGYLRNANIRSVIDVGAHQGEYGQELRAMGFRGRIESFEPQATAFSKLHAVAALDGNWKVHKTALGSQAGQVELRISESTAASSVLAVQNGPSCRQRGCSRSAAKSSP